MAVNNFFFGSVKTEGTSGSTGSSSGGVGGGGSSTNNYVSVVTFSTSDGVLTLQREGLGNLTVDLDGRYALSTELSAHGLQETTDINYETTNPLISGSARMSDWSILSTYAYFGHEGKNNATEYGVLHTGLGQLILNSTSTLDLRINGSTKAWVDPAGFEITGNLDLSGNVYADGIIQSGDGGSDTAMLNLSSSVSNRIVSSNSATGISFWNSTTHLGGFSGTTGNLDILQDFSLPTQKKIIFDGTGSRHTYIWEGANDILRFVLGGVQGLELKGLEANFTGTGKFGGFLKTTASGGFTIGSEAGSNRIQYNSTPDEFAVLNSTNGYARLAGRDALENYHYVTLGQLNSAHTLQTVTDNGNTTTNQITINKATSSAALILNTVSGQYTQMNFSNSSVQKSAIWWDNNNTEMVFWTGVNAITAKSDGDIIISSGSIDTRAGENVTNYKMADWDLISWNGNTVQLGGISSGQWNRVDFYTNNALRLSVVDAGINLTGVLNINGRDSVVSYSADWLYLATNTSGSTTFNQGVYTAAIMRADNGFQVGSGGSVFNVSNTGIVSLANAVWHTSKDGKPRFYFAPNSSTYFRTGNDYIFNNNSDGTIASMNSFGDFTANSFIKQGGTTSQFLKADGSVDSNTYLTTADLSNYVTLNTSQTISAKKIFGNTGSVIYTSATIEIYTNDNTPPSISFHRGGYSASTLYEASGQLFIKPWNDSNGYGIWHSGNDGTGSGLDADLLDGQNSSAFMLRGTDQWNTSSEGANRFYFSANARTYFGSGNGYEWRNSAGSNIGILDNSGNWTMYGLLTVNSDIASTGSLTLSASGSLHFGGGQKAMSGIGEWLYINTNSHFTNGIYTPTLFRSDTGLQVGSGGAHFSVNSTGHVVSDRSKMSNSAAARAEGYASAHVLQSQHWYGHTGTETLWLGEAGNHTTVRGSFEFDKTVYYDAAEAIRLRGASSYMSFYNGTGNRVGYIQGTATIYLASDAHNVVIQSNGYQTTFQGSNGYIYTPTWINIGAGSGIFSGTNGAYFYPSANTYGSWQINGSKGGYGGIYDSYSGINWMHDSAGNGGLYKNSASQWQTYWHVGNACLGIGNSATSSSYSVYAGKGAYFNGASYFGGTIATASHGDSDQWSQAYGARPIGLSFNTSTGILTLDRQTFGDLTVDLDGRYSTVNNYADSLSYNSGTGVLTLGRSGLSDLTTTIDLMTDTVSGDDVYFVASGNDTRSNAVTVSTSGYYWIRGHVWVETTSGGGMKLAVSTTTNSNIIGSSNILPTYTAIPFADNQGTPGFTPVPVSVRVYLSTGTNYYVWAVAVGSNYPRHRATPQTGGIFPLSYVNIVKTS